MTLWLSFVSVWVGVYGWVCIAGPCLLNSCQNFNLPKQTNNKFLCCLCGSVNEQNARNPRNILFYFVLINECLLNLDGFLFAFFLQKGF